ncbi:hypothetical protein RRG08_053259 [Elysia crispata]|uniref:Uncharacterized protein n=1 Tax=Elysia crispata TaxID=231223 RepID=A0AAE1E1K2_9GAST|nr:hypothetical protein RRG08_053259 [Elysia crispata]
MNPKLPSPSSQPRRSAILCDCRAKNSRDLHSSLPSPHPILLSFVGSDQCQPIRRCSQEKRLDYRRRQLDSSLYDARDVSTPIN